MASPTARMPVRPFQNGRLRYSTTKGQLGRPLSPGGDDPLAMATPFASLKSAHSLCHPDQAPLRWTYQSGRDGLNLWRGTVPLMSFFDNKLRTRSAPAPLIQTRRTPPLGRDSIAETPTPAAWQRLSTSLSLMAIFMARLNWLATLPGPERPMLSNGVRWRLGRRSPQPFSDGRYANCRTPHCLT